MTDFFAWFVVITVLTVKVINKRWRAEHSIAVRNARPAQDHDKSRFA